MAKTRIALIGRGYWGKILLTYIKEEFDLIYWIGNEPELLETFLNDDSVRNVIIATPPETHFTLCKRCIEKNKNIFCEKPLTLLRLEAFVLKELSEISGTILAVDYTHTFSKGLQRIKELRNTYGPILYYEFTSKNLGRFTNQNVYWTLASHFLAVLDIFEDINNFSFSFKDNLYNGNLCTDGTILFEKGKINVGLNDPQKIVEAKFYFANATAVYSPTFDKSGCTYFIEYRAEQKALKEQNTVKKSYLTEIESHTLLYAMQYFKSLINNKEESNIDRAIKVTKVLSKYW